MGYSGKLIQAEYTTVSDFREARCRAFHETRCNRGAYCNFMHIKHIPRAIKRRVVREMNDDHPEYLGQTKKEGKEKRKDKDKDKDKEKDKDRGGRSVVRMVSERRAVAAADAVTRRKRR